MGGIVISEISFLHNAESGKNNWWRYLLTIVATWGAQIALGMVIWIALMIILVMQGDLSLTTYYKYLYDPFFILPLTLIGSVASFIVLYLFIRFIHIRSFTSVITTKLKINWMRILKGVGLWLAILGTITVISLLIQPEGYQFTFNSRTFGILLIISLITFPIQASFEEVFFRGYLMQWFGLLSKKPIIPLVATSLIFGIVHLMNGANMTVSIFPVIEASIMGLMLGIITLGEDSIETAMGIHIINNIYAALIVSTEGSVLGDVPSVLSSSYDPYSSILWSVIIALVAIVIIFWGKKDKLFAIFK
ncbi:CPBP family intramembrane glutamic endopeptidase [Methanobacterium oryzae]|uniref:CPBP family intramembrane glutamic endopeptidase n=1 Tax=Methanobacterium oryzae TaxID=69540 RepID=UPI003D235E5D